MHKILKKILLLEAMLLIFPIMYLLFVLITGVGHPDLSNMMIMTIFIPLILMGLAGLFLYVWKEPLKKFISVAVRFLCFNYDKDVKNRPNKIWYISYFVFSGLYYFIFAIYFYFAGFKDFGQLIFLSWFGLMFIRLLHYLFEYSLCKKVGELLFSTFVPFGILLEIGLIFFKDVTIIWGEFGTYAFFSCSFLLATLVTEIFIGIVIDSAKAILKRRRHGPP